MCGSDKLWKKDTAGVKKVHLICGHFCESSSFRSPSNPRRWNRGDRTDGRETSLPVDVCPAGGGVEIGQGSLPADTLYASETIFGEENFTSFFGTAKVYRTTQVPPSGPLKLVAMEN